jgi:hypothetical protein
MADTDPRLLLLADDDNVLVARQDLAAGGIRIEGNVVTLVRGIARGHKIARRPIAAGDKVRKYGVAIGSASRAIAPGEHVHVHNLKSDYTATHLVGTVVGDNE